jgi:Protein of unknown function (DUF992)
MNIRAILCAASLAILTTTTQSAVAQQGVKIGRLRCNVSGGLGLIITSTKEMACTFTSAHGYREHYYGTIRKFGLDIGATDRGVLAWAVFAPSTGLTRLHQLRGLGDAKLLKSLGRSFKGRHYRA